MISLWNGYTLINENQQLLFPSVLPKSSQASRQVPFLPQVKSTPVFSPKLCDKDYGDDVESWNGWASNEEKEVVVDYTQVQGEGRLAEIPLSEVTAYKVFMKSSQRKNWSKIHIEVKIFVVEDGHFLWNQLLYFS